MLKRFLPFIVLSSTTLSAAVIEVPASKMVSLTNQAGRPQTNVIDGDMTFQLENNNGSGCRGFWLHPAYDTGYKTSSAMLVAAQLGGRPVAVTAETAKVWAGSAKKYCQIISITIK